VSAGPCYVNDSGYDVHRFDPADTEAPCGCGVYLAAWDPNEPRPWGWSLR
jgi:hypothetical protein